MFSTCKFNILDTFSPATKLNGNKNKPSMVWDLRNLPRHKRHPGYSFLVRVWILTSYLLWTGPILRKLQQKYKPPNSWPAGVLCISFTIFSFLKPHEILKLFFIISPIVFFVPVKFVCTTGYIEGYSELENHIKSHIGVRCCWMSNLVWNVGLFHISVWHWWLPLKECLTLKTDTVGVSDIDVCHCGSVQHWRLMLQECLTLMSDPKDLHCLTLMANTWRMSDIDVCCW